VKEDFVMHPHRLIPIATSIAICLFILFSALTNIKAQQVKPLVEAVEFLGNRRLSDEELLKHIKTRPGQVFSVKQIQLELDSIIGLGVFDKIQTRVSTEAGARGGIVVLFEVMELPVIKDVKFERLGYNQEVEIVELLRKKRLNIAKGAVYDPVQVHTAMQVIKEFLISHYWSNITVTVRQQSDTSTEVALTFLIEGDDYSFVEATRNFYSMKNHLISIYDTRR
jgi:outer membrane protein assembly factor BamA